MTSFQWYNDVRGTVRCPACGAAPGVVCVPSGSELIRVENVSFHYLRFHEWLERQRLEATKPSTPETAAWSIPYDPNGFFIPAADVEAAYQRILAAIISSGFIQATLPNLMAAANQDGEENPIDHIANVVCDLAVAIVSRSPDSFRREEEASDPDHGVKNEGKG